jgi:hypothetical protein
MEHEMLNGQDVDLDKFQDEVSSDIFKLRLLGYIPPPFVRDPLGGRRAMPMEYKEPRTQRELERIKQIQKEREKEQKAKVKEKKTVDKTKRKAENLIKRKNIRATICPGLKSISSDVFDIAKVITPLLVGATLAKTITIPLDPMLFGCIAMVIMRMGIATLCAQYQGEANKKS